MSALLTGASWDLAPHSAAKLKILGAYLRAWFPILGHSPKFDRVIYIDGFAGPGRYKKGEDGSPIIALKAALGAVDGRIQKPFEFHFVERKHRVAAALQANIDDLRSRRIWPQNLQVYVHSQQTFQEAYEQHIRPRLQANPRAPAFALVDPFGWTGIPMKVLSELMKRQSTEILVNFMFEEINRFINHPDQGPNFDELFSCQDWRNAATMSGSARKEFIVNLYRDRLRRSAGAQFVRSFEMRNQRNATDYFLYFASNNRLGLSRMKEAMWKVDPGGGVVFSVATDVDQTVLFQPEPDRHFLRRLLHKQFAGKSVAVETVENFVVDETPFLDTHYKKVLADMEESGDLQHLGTAARRPKTYADKSCLVYFAERNKQGALL